MAGNMGNMFHYPPQTPRDWQRQLRQLRLHRQQQPAGRQMGTRGIEGEQGQPLSPDDFQGGFQGQQPDDGIQGQVGPQQNADLTQPNDVTPQEKAVLRGVLDILKEGRVALSTGDTDELMVQRLTAAQAYLCGFMEAKGQQELGAYLATIPPLSTRGIVDDGEYDEMIDGLEQFLDPETRSILGAVLRAGGQVAWNAGKKVAGKVTMKGVKRVAKDVGTNLGASAIWDAGKAGFNRLRNR